MVKNIYPIIIVIIFAIVSGLPLLHKGLPPTHDGEYHIVRFYQFNKTFLDGNLYPRWAPDLNNGFGVPLFNYVYPLPNYIATFFRFFNLSFIDIFKLEMFLSLIIGAVFCYLWTKNFWGVNGGIVSSVFYTYSPYHFLDIYIRGSVGEAWSLALFPAFLWSIANFIRERKYSFFILSSIFLALIIFSHNILALMFFIFALSYVVYLISKEQNKKYLILNALYLILLGLGLSTVFWLPAILERDYVRGLEIFDVSRHFPDFYQLIIPSWGSGFSGENISNQMSFQIGIANLLVVIMCLMLVIVKIGRTNLADLRLHIFLGSLGMKQMGILIFFLAWFFFILFLMLKSSAPIWQSVIFMNYFQFPWRFLSLEILISSFLSGGVIYFWKSKLLGIVLILTSFFFGIGYTNPAYYHYRDDNYYISRSNFIHGTNSPGNVFNTVIFDTKLKSQNSKIEFLKGEGKIKSHTIKSTYYRFEVEAAEQSLMQVNTAYFPNWVVYVNNKETKAQATKNGLFTFKIQKGLNLVEIKFNDTFVRKVSTYITLFSLGILIVFLYKINPAPFFRGILIPHRIGAGLTHAKK